jgi:histidinol-phosphate aminotransferase
MHRRTFLTASAAAAVAIATPWSMGTRAQGTASMLRLNSNENPLGMSALAKAAASEALALGHRYSFGQDGLLAAEIGAIEGLEKGNVTLANGSTAILEAVAWQQLTRGATLVQPAITFGDMGRMANATGLKRIDVPMADGFRIDLEGLERASKQVDGPVLVYLVTPNNPTGLLSPSGDLQAWVKRAPENVFFLIDEAYHELVDDPAYESSVRLIQEGYDNLLVARTFSKIYAMAGMRLGYAMGTEPVIDSLKRYYSSWSINIAAIQAGRASLKDEAFKALSFASNRAARALTESGLRELELNYIPTQGNFLIHEIRMPLPAYQKAMRDEGILVGRDMNLGDGWNRLSLGTSADMERFLTTLKSLQDRGWA